ncbi:malate dehydrogenase [Bradyrhizobium septentrionale]|uniref:Malate dehydrogenase n=1 Tax=Bradyrhizobium septentrionale TaxID=1404411 RepID=A0A974A2R0_9BRAD|nr:malate dehydrogenase [Bradyrhizobium septentrionale]UGY16319.1 malate dehydrogenase [Bradyrhizobium septentrionale]
MSVVSVADVENANGVLVVGARDILTPLAADRAKELNVRIERSSSSAREVTSPVVAPSRPTVQLSAKAEPAAKPIANAGAVQPGALSGALYRRGAPVPAAMRVQGDAASAARDDRPRAAVIGAGHVGAMTALRLAETSLFSRVTLVDIVPGLAAGLALDMWHSAPLRRFTTRIEGSTDLSALEGARYIVMTAGRPRQPGMSRTDLTGVNAEIVGNVADGIRRYAPASVVVVVTNPLEEMTHLMAKRTGFPSARVIGMAGVLDSARFCSLVALEGIARPEDVDAIALGSHGAEMVIPLSLAKVQGRPLEQLIPKDRLAAIVERARDSGAEVVKLLQKGSAYFSPAESAASMVAAMVKGDSELIAACVQSGGAYGVDDTRIGLPVRLDTDGVKEIAELPLRPDERAALAAATGSIAKRISELA